MGSKTNTWENGLLLMLFNNTAFTLVGDSGGLLGSSSGGSLYLSLHTADPSETGSQSSSEISYTSYVRKGVGRTSGNWTVTGNSVTNAANAAFPECTGGGPVSATHIGIGTSSSGAGKLLYSGALEGTLVITNGNIPQFDAGDLDITED